MVGRFSPSPTGKLHIGSLRTALISYIQVRKNFGDFVLRIEDTDAIRSTKESEKEIFDSFEWLGITYRDSVIRQSEQQASGVYTEIVESLIKAGFAYRCACTTDTLKSMKIQQLKNRETRIGYVGLCRDSGHDKGVVRINGKKLAEARGLQHYRFEDSLFGSRRVDHRDIPDAVIMRADGTATYILANTLDDMQAGVDFISRGADIITQTATQIALREAIHYSTGIDNPEVKYTHLPLILGNKNEKLSKRNPDTKSILEYKAQGFFKEAIMQFVLSLGNKSIPIHQALSLEEIVELYDVTKLRRNDTAFTESQLRYINGQHMAKASAETLNAMMLELYGAEYNPLWVNEYKTRCKTVLELHELCENFSSKVSISPKDVEELKAANFSIEACKTFRERVLEGHKTPPLEALLA